ncbi:MAG: hypothetical protein M0Z41_08875 [Peptococcaceae bacterium]|jgi:hypothetical protein|nr:hypothetical protein [Peptococcaceae bacterium]
MRDALAAAGIGVTNVDWHYLERAGDWNTSENPATPSDTQEVNGAGNTGIFGITYVFDVNVNTFNNGSSQNIEVPPNPPTANTNQTNGNEDGSPPPRAPKVGLDG